MTNCKLTAFRSGPASAAKARGRRASRVAVRKQTTAAREHSNGRLAARAAARWQRRRFDEKWIRDFVVSKRTPRLELSSVRGRSRVYLTFHSFTLVCCYSVCLFCFVFVQ